LIAGDFNEDGTPDLAVANRGGSSTNYLGIVSILLGRGRGFFAKAHQYLVGTGHVSVTTADFDKDGHLDLAVTHSYMVSVFLGHGDGSFALAKNYITGNSPWAAVPVDLNSDGFIDLAVAQNAGNVASFLNKGDGTFLFRRWTQFEGLAVAIDA